MNAELPDELRSLDDQLKLAMRDFAPPANLDAKIVSHISRRSRLSLVPTTRVAKGAAAAVAASLLMTVGYVADRQLSSGSSSLFGDIGRLVAFDSPDRANLTSDSYIQDDIDYVPAGSEFKLREESGRERNLEGLTKTASGVVIADRAERDEQESFANAEGGLSGLAADEKSGRQGEGDKSSGDGWNSMPALRYGTVLADAKPYKGRERESNAGLVGNIVMDEQNIAIDGVLHFLPGQISLRGVGAVPTDRPRESYLSGQQGENGGFVSSFDGEVAEGQDSTKSKPGDGRGVDAPKPGPAAADAPAAAAQPAVAVRQKVIRSGTVEFEVDSFDTALLTISKLVIENDGFVASTDSAKLPNGKTRGAVTLRLPPERLDTLVLMLRGIGDLKSQKISAQDVSKQYTDIESQLRAARAMEERLLDMIKNGKGSIKDLLAAEKELGGWREKIEKLEGEIRYYDNLIGLSTLTVVLQERDIKASAASIEIETVSAGVETDDVEKARAEIIKAIDEAKGRIITSELKKLDAGQFSATIVAEVAADRSGPVIDRLKQVGKVARLDVDRKQTTVDGTAPPVAGAPVEQKPTRLTISLYNLANVAPRLTTSATLASDDVEAAYKKIMALVEQAGGRIVTSKLQRPEPDQVQATLQLEVPSAEAAKAQAEMTAMGEVMSLQLSENPDTANVTTAKQGFAVRIISAAGVPARETSTIQLACPDVTSAYRALVDLAAKLDARLVQSNLTDGDGDQVNAVLHVEVSREALAEWEQASREAGDVMTRSVGRSTDLQNTLDSKVRINLALFPADRLPPRQTTTATIRVPSAESQQQVYLAKVTTLGGRIIDQTVSRDPNGRSNARVVFDVPRDEAGKVLNDLRSAGDIWSMNTSTNPQAPDGALSRTRFDLQFSEREALVGAENGFWSSIKAGLATSLAGLGYSLRLLVVAVCLVAPWAAVLWGGWRLFRRTTKGVPSSTSVDA